MIRRAMIATLFLLSAMLSGAVSAETTWEPSAADKVRISETEARGRLIYAYDQAAWYSTDEVRRLVPPSSLPKHGGGWVVEPHGDLLRVTYYGLDSGTPLAFFHADMRGREVVTSHVFTEEEDRRLSPQAMRMIQARQAARAFGAAQGFKLCSTGAVNELVLPPASADAPVTVYLLTSQVTIGEYPFGGHYEVDIGPDGKVIASRPFTKGCLNMTAPTNPEGGVAALYVTHLLDPMPTEIHVWLSLWMARPVIVGTGPDRIWVVADGRIEPVDPQKSPISPAPR